MVSKRTYLPLLMDRWTAGTQELTFEERGFYISLLVWMYDTGEAVKDSDHAARILRCDKRTSRRLLGKLRPKFRPTSAGLRHKVLDNLIRNGGRIKGLQIINLPTDPDPDPDPEEEKEKRPKGLQKKAANRGSRLPEDWQPSQAETEWATREFPRVDHRLETDKFRDYWLSMPGQRGCKLSWARTWKNWLRNAKTHTGGKNGSDYDKPIRGSADWYRERAKRRMDEIEDAEVLGTDDGFVRGETLDGEAWRDDE